MRLEDQKNRTCIGPHLGRPQHPERRVISVVKIGYVRRSEIWQGLGLFGSRGYHAGYNEHQTTSLRVEFGSGPGDQSAAGTLPVPTISGTFASLGSTTPRFLTILNLPPLAWPIYMCMRA